MSPENHNQNNAHLASSKKSDIITKNKSYYISANVFFLFICPLSYNSRWVKSDSHYNFMFTCENSACF